MDRNVNVHEEKPNGRGIVAYDFLFCRGGAEQVTLELAHGLSNADLCFGFRNREHFPDDALAGIRYFDLGVATRFAGGRTLAGLRAYRQKTKFIQRYDWAIFSGYMAPEAVYSHPTGLNIYYCHTVPRFAYDLHNYYLQRIAWWKRPFFRALAGHVRHRYPRSIERMDTVIANSRNVRRRIFEHMGIDATVIHPPCDIAGYKWLGQGDYYLSTARLEPYKRVELIVEAFRRMPDKRLVVASSGSEMRRLMQLADGAMNISFTGWVSDARLRELTGHAIATLYLPIEEDFGISPVESMAAGKPVIGVAEGGLLETVVDKRSGLLLETTLSADNIVDAVRALSGKAAAAMRNDCESRSHVFCQAHFLTKMRAVVADGLSRMSKS